MHNLLYQSKKALEKVEVGGSLTRSRSNTPGLLIKATQSVAAAPNVPIQAENEDDKPFDTQRILCGDSQEPEIPSFSSPYASCITSNDAPENGALHERPLASEPLTEGLTSSGEDPVSRSEEIMGRDLPGNVNLTIIGNSFMSGGDVNIYAVNGDLSVNKVATSSILDMLNTRLKPVSAAYDSYTSSSNQRSRCFEGTRVRLLKDIQDWVRGYGSNAPIYILDGVAGIGKSTVAQTLAELAAAEKILGASFFFSREEEQRKTARHFFPTITFHLARFREDFAQRISDALERHPDAAQKNIQPQFIALIFEPLRELLARRGSTILIVIDALDECDEEEAKTLLLLLAQYIHDLPQLKFFVTSRPEWHIRDILDRDSNHERFHLHEIEDSIVQSDIRLYLRFCLSVEQVQKMFPGRRPPWQPSGEHMQMLCGICGSLFILASTATKFILDNKRSNPEKQLSRLLEGVSPTDFSGSKRTDAMDRFYIQIIISAAPDDLEEEDDWIGQYQTVMGAVIVLQNPLPCRVLAALLNVDPDYITDALLHLHSLVAPMGPESVFRVHHKSFPDFITSEERIQKALRTSPTSLSMPNHPTSLFLIHPSTHHSEVGHACFRIMKQHLKWNIANIPPRNWYNDRAELGEGLLHRSIPDELAYACTHWASHLHAAGSLNDELQKRLEDWAFNSMLTWLEVMSILDQIELAYLMVEKVQPLIDVHLHDWPGQARTKMLLSDMSRLVQQNPPILKISPLHVYWSGLSFTPMESTIRGTYRVRADMIRVIVGLDEEWEPFLATLSGHSGLVSSLTFSKDDRILASGSYDGTARLWDGRTGAHIATLVGHSGLVTSVAFSSSNPILASASHDGTVRLWNVGFKLASHLATLTGHSSRVLSVAFSKDGSQLASGSEDTTLRVWNGNTFTHFTTLHGHSASVTTVAFSSNGTIASGSYDNTLRLWDGKTGTQLRAIELFCGTESTIFLGDGLTVATGCDDKMIHLWDSQTGSRSSSMRGHHSIISSLAFSAGNTTLVSGSYDQTVRLWDTTTGANIGTLRGHSHYVTSVAITSNGSRFASGSGSSDKTIRLWDGRASVCNPQSNRRHKRAVSAIAISSGTSILASTSDEPDVMLFNSDSGAHIATFNVPESSWQTLSNNTSRMAAILRNAHNTVGLIDVHTNTYISTLVHSALPRIPTFSADGSRLASASGETMWLWDGKTGTLIATHTAHPLPIDSFTFSRDGTRLASTCGGASNYDYYRPGKVIMREGTEEVQLWDGMTGAHIATLTGHSGGVQAIAFSADGTKLTSGSQDNTIRLWDRKTGDCLAILNGHSETVVLIAFSSDDQICVSAAPPNDHTIRLWDVTTGAHIGALDVAAYEPIALISLPNTQPPYAATPPPSTPKTHSAHFLMLVKRRNTQLSGLVLIKQRPGGIWDNVPFCWFPPHLQAKMIAVDGSSLAIGCGNGHVFLLDISPVLAQFE